MMRLSGPMFEAGRSDHWESIYKKDGAHYNIYGSGHSESAMAALREFFTESTDYSLNFVLFSTSGVHGTYRTIEDAEKELQSPAEGDEECSPEVTFLIIQPRTVTMRYGNCEPKNQSDIDFLKAIREKSKRAIMEIGWPEESETERSDVPEGLPEGPNHSNPQVTQEGAQEPKEGGAQP